jgi:serine/threonine protein kinase
MAAGNEGLGPGAEIDRKYRVVRELGTGAMGSVYEAEHLVLRRRVAIKLLHAVRVREPIALQRFEREARAASSIGSRHVIAILDYGETPGGEPYLVMEYLAGETLADRLERHRVLDAEELVPIVAQVLAGLEAAHAAGIVHRDLKPQNVWLCAGGGELPVDFVKLLDFGVAKLRSECIQLTEAGTLIGTPRFMAPEQLLGETTADHRVDLYAAAVILFRALSGRWPFPAETLDTLIYEALHTEPLRLDALMPSISPRIAAVVARALARSPADRYPTARAMASDLAASLPTLSRVPLPPPRAESPAPQPAPQPAPLQAPAPIPTLAAPMAPSVTLHLAPPAPTLASTLAPTAPSATLYGEPVRPAPAAAPPSPSLAHAPIAPAPMPPKKAARGAVWWVGGAAVVALAIAAGWGLRSFALPDAGEPTATNDPRKSRKRDAPPASASAPVAPPSSHTPEDGSPVARARAQLERLARLRDTSKGVAMTRADRPMSQPLASGSYEVIGYDQLDDPTRQVEFEVAGPLLALCGYAVRKNGDDDALNRLGQCASLTHVGVVRTETLKKPVFSDAGQPVDRGSFRGDVLVYELATGELRGAYRLELQGTERPEPSDGLSWSEVALIELQVAVTSAANDKVARTDQLTNFD